MTNEPAFPASDTVANGQRFAPLQSGMTLRDYFAAKAMQAFISEGSYNRAANDYPKTEDNDNRLSAASYRIADSMLKAREL